MLYSVWSWDDKKFDYYKTNESEGFQPLSRHISSSANGLAPEDVAIKLPQGAIKVGSGELAQGYIAVEGVEGVSNNTRSIFFAAGVAAVLYGVLKLYG